MVRRTALALLVLLCLAAGFLLGALNPQPVVFDLFGAKLEVGLGVLVATSALIGALIAGLACVIGSWFRRSRMTRADAIAAAPTRERSE